MIEPANAACFAGALALALASIGAFIDRAVPPGLFGSAMAAVFLGLGLAL